jgi:hypothetical protein
MASILIMDLSGISNWKWDSDMVASRFFFFLEEEYIL